MKIQGPTPKCGFDTNLSFLDTVLPLLDTILPFLGTIDPVRSGHP